MAHAVWSKSHVSVRFGNSFGYKVSFMVFLRLLTGSGVPAGTLDLVRGRRNGKGSNGFSTIVKQFLRHRAVTDAAPLEGCLVD